MLMPLPAVLIMSNPELEASPMDVDRLSDLPEGVILHILSFLPTKFAIRTSVLSRRYLRLWTASPSMDIDRGDFPPGRAFYSTTSRCVRLRDPAASLFSFCLTAYDPDFRHLATKTASKWLTRAHSLGLCNLNLAVYVDDFLSLLPLILTFHSLQSLHISSRDYDSLCNPRKVPSLIPPNFLATGLRSLHLRVKIPCSDLKRLVMEQTNLEDLCLELPSHTGNTNVDLVSPSVKTMKLVCRMSYPEVHLFFPALEVLDLTIDVDCFLKKFTAKMPLLRKADLKIEHLTEDKVPLLADILRCFTNVLHFSILIQKTRQKDPEPVPGLSRSRRKRTLIRRQFHLLVAPGQDLPTFAHLRSLELLIHFHDDGISDLICFLQNAPVLESVELNHVDNKCLVDEEVWMSKLPQDSEGGNQHRLFSDLHLGDRKTELIRLLVSCIENPQKKLKI